MSRNFLTRSNVFSALRNASEAVLRPSVWYGHDHWWHDISVGSTLGVAAILISRTILAGYHPSWLCWWAGCRAGHWCYQRSHCQARPTHQPLWVRVLRASVFALGRQWITGLCTIPPAITMGSIAGVPSTVVLVVAFYIIFWYVSHALVVTFIKQETRKPPLLGSMQMLLGFCHMPFSNAYRLCRGIVCKPNGGAETVGDTFNEP